MVASKLLLEKELLDKQLLDKQLRGNYCSAKWPNGKTTLRPRSDRFTKK